MIADGENKQVEFKEKVPKNESIVKTIIAFSNTAGGKLIIGVSDDRAVVGVADDDIFELKDRLSSLIFDDIVEVISVGGFVNGLTLDEISNGRSELRNKVIANLFKELQFIESWGSGVEKVQNSCNDKGIKFELREKGLFVEAVFERPIKGKNADKISETTEYDRIQPNTTDYDQLILEYLQANQKITRKEAKSFLKLGETKIKELFNELIDRGLIQRVGAGRSTYYTLQSTEV